MSLSSRDDIFILLNKFKKQKNATLEIQFNPMILEKEEFVRMYTAFHEQAMNTEYKEIISSKSMQRERGTPVIRYGSKDIFFKHGIKIGDPLFTEKVTMYKPYNVTYEENGDNKEYTIQLFDIQYRNVETIKRTGETVNIVISNIFQLKSFPEWLIQIDLVKSLKVLSNIQTNLKKYKDMLLRKYESFPEDVEISAFDYVQCTIMYTGTTKNVQKKDIHMLVQYVGRMMSHRTESTTSNYQDIIFYVATIIYHRNPIMIQQFQKKSGFKRLVNSVVEMNRNIYFSQVIPNIDSFYVTDKIDGRRCLILILTKDETTHVYLLSDALYTIRQYTVENMDIRDPSVSVTILDAEMVYSDTLKDTTILDLHALDVYVFDVIMFHNKNVAFVGFEKRYDYFEKVDMMVRTLKLGNVKKFVKLNATHYKSILDTFYKECKQQEKYEIDGLIFTPSSTLHTSMIQRGTKKVSINTNYSNMICYKWKPIEKLTIDFFIAAIPEHIRKKPEYAKFDMEPTQSMYILCSGIDLHTFQQLQFQLCPYYKEIIPKKYHALPYFPIQFAPDDHPYVYIYFSKEANLHNKVGEFLYEKNKWRMLRIRDDRDVEIARGEYYGNALRYSELIWKNIHNPLTFEQLLNPSNEAYFAKTSEDIYLNQRNFNSFVKTEILRLAIHPTKYKPSSTNWLMDLACGRGQDLGRVVKLGFKSVVMLDKDMDAIYQLLERKYNLYKKPSRHMFHMKGKKEPSLSAKIYVHQMDLSEAYKKNIQKIKHLGIPKGGMDVIICNFAIHYLMDSEEHISNLLLFMSHFLKPSGRFIFTCFDGNRIFELLCDTDTYHWEEDGVIKYSIQKRYQSTVLTNLSQKIGVILPFTNKEYYEEYLVNLLFLNSILEKIGFQKELSAPFSSLLDKFKKENPKIYDGLSKQDKDFISLYTYNMYIKDQKVLPSEENIALLMETI